MHLEAVDLNLLVVLRALLDARSIKRAADRLALSPSATSHALGRLRDQLGDELLVRAGKEMTPTARALRLQPKLREVLDGAELLFRPDAALEPATLKRAFAFGTNDFFELVILPRWSAQIAKLAPGVDLLSRPVRDDVASALRAGEVDLAMGVFGSMPDDVRTAPMLRSRFVCLVRAGHPALGRRLTPKRFAELEHVLVSPRGRGLGVVDRKLAERGLERRVSRVVANFVAAPPLVASGDYVLTVSEHIADRFAEGLGLERLKPPVPIPDFTVSVAWHRRQDGDPALDWLRATLLEVTAALEPGRVGA